MFENRRRCFSTCGVLMRWIVTLNVSLFYFSMIIWGQNIGDKYSSVFRWMFFICISLKHLNSRLQIQAPMCFFFLFELLDHLGRQSVKLQLMTVEWAFLFLQTGNNSFFIWFLKGNKWGEITFLNAFFKKKTWITFFSSRSPFDSLSNY